MELGDHIEALRRDPTSVEAARKVREESRARGALVQYAEAFAERGRRLAEQGHASEAIASYIEAALVFEEELDDLAQAARLYQLVLDLDPAHRRALFALGLLLHDLSRFEDLVALYRRRLDRSTDDGERTTLHLYVAEILSERLDRGQAAFEEVMTAARLAPQNIRIISRLQRLGEQAGKVEEVAVAIGDLILNQEDRRVRAALTLHLAELYMGPLEDTTRALAHYKAALADDGGNPEVLSQVEDVFRERERFDQLAELLEEAAGDRRVGPQRVRLERELARIYELELGDKKRALAALTRAARLFPDDRDLLDEVMRLGLSMGALDVVASTFDDVAASTSNGLLRTYLQLKLGHIYGNVLDRPADAMRAYDAILTEDPGHKEARRRLGNLCERTGDFARLAELAEEEARLVDGTDKVEPLRRLARVKERSLGDAHGARDAYRRILDLVPGDPEAAKAMTRVEAVLPASARAPEASPVRAAEPVPARSGPRAAVVVPEAGIGVVARDDELLGALVAGRRPMPDFAADLSREEDERDLAERLSDVPTETVEDMLAGALADAADEDGLFGGGDEEVIEDADDLMTEAALTVTTSQAVSADPLPDDAGQVHLRALDDDALDAEDVVIDGESGANPVWSSGDVAEEVSARYGGVVEAIAAPPSPVPSLIGRVVPMDAAPPAHAMPMPPAAPARTSAPPARASAAPPARASVPPPPASSDEDGETVAAASVPVPPAGSASSDGPTEAAPAISAAVARLAEIQHGLAEASRLGDRTRELALLEELVEAHLAASETERAFFALVRLVRQAPGELAMRRLIELGRRAGTFGALTSTADEILPRLNLDARGRLGLALAEVEATDMKAQDRAEARLSVLHEELPDDPEIFERWTSILEQRGAFGALSAAIEKEARRTHDAEQARALWLRAARVRGDRLGDRAGAATVLMAALERSPDDEGLREAALAALGEAGRWAEVTAILESRLYRVGPQARVALRREIARIASAELGDAGLAEKMLRLALSEQPHDEAALDALVALYESASRWEAVIEVLSSQLPIASAGGPRAALRRRLAAVAELRLSRPDLALQHLDAAVREEPTDLDALASIERLRREAGDFAGVVEALVRLARVHPEPAVRAHRAIEAARIERTKLGDPASAVGLYREALSLLPDHTEALGELASLFEELQDDEGAVATLVRLASALDGVARAHVHLRAGRLLEYHLEELEEAGREYGRALEAAPVDAEVLTELARWREAGGDYAGASNLIERQAELTDDDRRRATLWSRVAEIARMRLDDPDRAIRASEQVLLADPDDLAVEASLGELYLARGAPDDIDRAYTHLARAGRGLRRADATRALGLYLAAGGAAITLGLREQAIAAFDAVRELDPRRVEALWPLARLLAASEQWARAHDVAASIVLHHDASLTPAEQAEVLALMARARRALDDREGAIRLAERSLATRIERHDALGLLADLHASGGAPAEAADALRRLAAITRDARERRAHVLRAAHLWGDEADDLGRAIAILGEVHVATKADVEVAELLAQYRERAGEPRGAVAALATTARALEGEDRAALLVKAMRVASGPAHDRAEARRLAEEALLVVPGHPEAVSELARLLELDRDFARLAVLHEENAAHDPAGLEEAARVYGYRLGRPLEAARIWRRIHAQGRADRSTTEALARALESAAAAAPTEAVRMEREALALWAQILDTHPGHLDALRHAARLASPWRRRVYTEVLAVLGEATAEEASKLGPDGPWSSIAPSRTGKPIDVPAHPREHSPLEPLMTQVGYSLLVALEEDVPEPRPKKRDKVAITALAPPIAAALQETAALFGQPVPPVYVRDDAKEAMAPAFVDDKPALIVSLAVTGRLQAGAHRFYAGRALSLLRARALPLALLPLEAIRDALEGLVRERVGPELLFGEAKSAKRRGKLLERALSPSARLAVTSLVSEWLVKPNRATLFDEREAISRTAERSGLIACGSLSVAVECMDAVAGRDRRWKVPLVELAASSELAALVES